MLLSIASAVNMYTTVGSKSRARNNYTVHHQEEAQGLTDIAAETSIHCCCMLQARAHTHTHTHYSLVAPSHTQNIVFLRQLADSCNN